MRVRKLKLRGFMTYKGEATIDFTRLFDKKIFLISGPTGSGKTTIFDAIAFALYEEVPREIDQDRLRSDYLTEDDPYTYVSLEFSIGDMTYLIKRIPSQRAVELKRPKNINHRVELYDITLGKKLLADKVSDARDMVKKIIGLDGGQFSKVMVLAQGEFQKFLQSKSDEKADLLSDIFKTDKYRAIQEELKERASTSKKEIESVDKDLNNIISYNEDLKDLIARDDILGLDFKKIRKDLEEKIESDENKLRDFENKEEGLRKSQADLYEKIEKAKTHNENIKKYRASEDLIKKLLEDLEEKTRDKEDLELLSFAKNIEIYEKRIKSAKADLSLIEKTLKSSVDKLEEKEKALGDIKDDIIKLPDLRKDLDKEKIGLEEKKKLKKSYESYLENKKDFDQVKEYENKRDELSKRIESFQKNLNELRKTYEKKREGLLANKDEIQKLVDKKKDLGARLKDLRRDEDKLKENLSYKKDIGELEKSYKDEDEKRKLALKDRDLALINKLIDRLNDEGVCPVCGTNHDEKIDKHEISKLDYESIEERLNKIRLELERSKALLTANKKDISSSLSYEEIKKIIKENEDLEKSYDDLIGQKKKAFDEGSKDLDRVCDKGTRTAKDFDEAKKHLEKIEDKLKDLEEKRVSYLSQKDQMEAVDIGRLSEEISQKEGAIKDLSNFIEKTDRKREDLQRKIAELRSNIKILKENKEKTKKNIQAFKKEFEEKLREKFESLEVYQSYLKRKEEIEEKREENEGYFKKLEKEKTIRDGLIAYNDKKAIDLDSLDKDLKKVTDDLSLISEKRAQLSQAIRALGVSFEKIESIEQRYLRLKGESMTLKRLSDLANGKTSLAEDRQRIDFETFVLSFYFDKVLAYANKRFKKMTDGQFVMVRKKEAGDKRSKSGLDIEIFDYNTGRLRPASTLSGGESFMASLSLALGLSDEIAQENGGIRIDTLFIDEGFGTLSKDFLENAIGTIERLSQEDRFVGLISHVDELKDAIDSKIVISYDPSEGSNIKVVV